MLEALILAPKVTHHVQRILIKIARRHPDAVLDYFGARLAATRDDSNFEPVPYNAHGLNEAYQGHAELVVKHALKWFARDSRLFEFRGARLLHALFPDFSPEFAAQLSQLAATGDKQMTQLALATISTYRGRPETYSLLKEIVATNDGNNDVLSGVRSALLSTGVVGGERGLALAWKEKLDLLEREWITDERPAVSNFARELAKRLRVSIASEERRVDQEREMRIRDFDGDQNIAESSPDPE